MDISLSLAAKLGSIAVHVEESLGDRGHPLDVYAVQSLLHDDEVIAFVENLDPVLLPVMRG